MIAKVVPGRKYGSGRKGTPGNPSKRLPEGGEYLSLPRRSNASHAYKTKKQGDESLLKKPFDPNAPIDEDQIVWRARSEILTQKTNFQNLVSELEKELKSPSLYSPLYDALLSCVRCYGSGESVSFYVKATGAISDRPELGKFTQILVFGRRHAIPSTFLPRLTK